MPLTFEERLMLMNSLFAVWRANATYCPITPDGEPDIIVADECLERAKAAKALLDRVSAAKEIRLIG